MSFHDWIFSIHPEGDRISGQWGLLHILTLLGCIAIIIGLSFFRHKDIKVRNWIIRGLAILILFFELARRIINTIKGNVTDFDSFLYAYLPRPWCAISCWAIMISVLVNKKWFYNFAAATSLLCALIFFAYPGAGFNNKYITFENTYSIATHALIFISSITLITLNFTDYRYRREEGAKFKNTAFLELISLGVVFVYAFIEIFLLKIEDDPLYFMPGNDVMEILGMSWGVYVVVYILFLALYFNLFYLIPMAVRKIKSRKQNKQ